MDERKKRGREQERGPTRAASQKHAKDKAAEEKFLERRHHEDRADHRRDFSPEDRLTQRIITERDQEGATAEQGNSRDCKPSREVCASRKIFLQAEIAPASYPEHPEKRPKQKKRGD